MAKKQLSATAGQDVLRYIKGHLGEAISYTTIDQLCGTTSSNQQYNLIVGPLEKDGVLVAANKKVMRGNEQAPIYKEYRICRSLPAKLVHSAAFIERGANMGTLNKALADLSPPLTENGFLGKKLAASRRVPQEAIPPATYDGSGGTQRLISTLRSRRR